MFPQLSYHRYSHTTSNLINAFVHPTNLKTQKKIFFIRDALSMSLSTIHNILTILTKFDHANQV